MKKTFYTSAKIPKIFHEKIENLFLEFYNKNFMNFKILLSEILLTKI